MSILDKSFTSSKPFRAEPSPASEQENITLGPLVVEQVRPALKNTSAFVAQTAFNHAFIEQQIPHRSIKQTTPEQRKSERTDAFEIFCQTFQSCCSQSDMTPARPEYLQIGYEYAGLLEIERKDVVTKAISDPELIKYVAREGYGGIKDKGFEDQGKLLAAISNKIRKIQMQFFHKIIDDVIEATKQTGKITQKSYNELLESIDDNLESSSLTKEIKEKFREVIASKSLAINDSLPVS